MKWPRHPYRTSNDYLRSTIHQHGLTVNVVNNEVPECIMIVLRRRSAEPGS